MIPTAAACTILDCIDAAANALSTTQTLSPTLVYGFTGDSIGGDARRLVESIVSAETQTRMLVSAGQVPNRNDANVQLATSSLGATSIQSIIESVGAVDDFGAFSTLVSG